MAKQLGGTAVLLTTTFKVLCRALAMLIGCLMGVITITLSGISFAFGTSDGAIMAIVGMSYFRHSLPSGSR
jgi:putative transport protein